MSNTAADTGLGSKFSIGNGAGPEVFTDVAEVVDITPPEQMVGTTDATHMQSPNGNKEYIATLGDQGPADITVNYVPGGAAETALLAALAARAPKNYRITFPSTNTWTFGAIMTSFKPGQLTPDGKMTATASFQPTGASLVTA